MNMPASFPARTLTRSLGIAVSLMAGILLNPISSVVAQSEPPPSLAESILAEKWEMKSDKKPGERVVEFRRGHGQLLETLEIRLLAMGSDHAQLGYTHLGRFTSIGFAPQDAPKIRSIFEKWKEWAKTAKENNVKDVQKDLANYSFGQGTYKFSFFVKTSEMFDEEHRAAQLLKEYPMNVVTAPSLYLEARRTSDGKDAAPAFDDLSTAAVETSLFLLSQLEMLIEESKDAAAAKAKTEGLFK